MSTAPYMLGLLHTAVAVMSKRQLQAAGAVDSCCRGWSSCKATFGGVGMGMLAVFVTAAAVGSASCSAY